MENFEIDLNLIQDEYYSRVKNLVDSQEGLFEELKDAIGDNKDHIISKLQTIEKNVLEWNEFVESIINRYKGEPSLVQQLEVYSIQPQR